MLSFSLKTYSLARVCFIKNAKNKLIKKKCDWIIANNILEDPNIFGGENNTITLITRNKIESWDKCSKTEVAKKLSCKVIEELLVL